MDWVADIAKPVNRYASPLLAGLAVSAFLAATQPQRQWLVRHSLQPMRESVLLTRPVLDPYDPRQRSIVTLSLTGVPWSYDPNIIVLSDVDELVRNLEEADRNGKTLYVNFANAWTASASRPALYTMIEDDRLFEKIASIQGFDPTLTAFVRRYKPGTIAAYPRAQ